MVFGKSLSQWLYLSPRCSFRPAKSQTLQSTFAHFKAVIFSLFSLMHLMPRAKKKTHKLSMTNFRLCLTGASRNRTSTVFFHGYSRVPFRIRKKLEIAYSWVPCVLNKCINGLVATLLTTPFWQILREFFIVIVAESNLPNSEFWLIIIIIIIYVGKLRTTL